MVNENLHTLKLNVVFVIVADFLLLLLIHRLCQSENDPFQAQKCDKINEPERMIGIE